MHSQLLLDMRRSMSSRNVVLIFSLLTLKYIFYYGFLSSSSIDTSSVFSFFNIKQWFTLSSLFNFLYPAVGCLVARACAFCGNRNAIWIIKWTTYETSHLIKTGQQHTFLFAIILKCKKKMTLNCAFETKKYISLWIQTKWKNWKKSFLYIEWQNTLNTIRALHPIHNISIPNLFEHKATNATLLLLHNVLLPRWAPVTMLCQVLSVSLIAGTFAGRSRCGKCGTRVYTIYRCQQILMGE